ncbi:MAG: hypothetical protein ACE5Z5_07595 [Candidatus Bathyarchaeia archaeon]
MIKLATRFWGRHLNKRRLIALYLSLICLASVIGGLSFWESEQGAESTLQEYIGRLEDSGYAIEERSLTDFHVDGIIRIHFFGDFLSFSRQEGINNVYLDKRIHALYFLRPSRDDKIEAYIFYYK